MLLRAEGADVRLDGFELPQLDTRFLVITAKDIPGENAVNIMGTKVPLLADNYISYVGQPLLVLFGPDYESTELALEKIKVITRPFGDDEKKPEAPPLPEPLTFSWNSDNPEEDKKEKQEERKIESSLSVIPSDIKKYVRYNILTWTENNGSIHTQCPSQWAELVRKTIASSTLTNQEYVTVHQEKYLSHYDEFLLTPAFYGAFTAIASIKTKLPAEMKIDSLGRRPKIDFSVTTWLNAENRPRHEEISVTVDGGAYCLNGSEIQRQIMADIVPRYSLESFKVEITNVSSPTIPTLFSGSSIHSSTQSFIALHNSRLAERALMSPLKHYLTTMRESTKFTDWMPKHDLTDLGEKMKSVAADSDYERKWSAGSLHAGDFGLQGYLYGIGLSSGLSVSGLSTTCARENQFQSQISYTAKKNISIRGAVPASVSEDRTLKDLISQFFGKGTIPVICQESNLKGCDSGPDILYTYQTTFLTQLMKAANKLSTLIGEDDSPIDLNFNAQNLTLPCEFEASGYGAAVCEINIPKVSLVPVAKKLWLDVALALPYTRGVQRKIKSIATETLAALGARLDDNFSISVKFSSEKKDANVYSSLENTTRFLVTSSYVAALWQALGEKQSLMAPPGAREIDAILQGGQDR